ETMTETSIARTAQRLRSARSWCDVYEIACEIEEWPNSGWSHEIARLIAWDGDPNDAFALVESVLLYATTGQGASGDWLPWREEARYWHDVLNIYVEAFEKLALR